MIQEIFIIHHSHTDLGYTNHPETVMANQREYLRRAMRLAERYAGGPDPFKWTVETLLTLEDFLRTARTSEIDRLQALYQAGLIDFAGLWGNWSPLADVPVLTETIGIAARLRCDYGFRLQYALNCDVTGLPWGIVELLLDGGYRGLAMAMNRTMARDPQPRPRGFCWAGPSGRPLLTWHGDHYGLGQHFGVPRVKTHSGWVVDIDASISKMKAYLTALEVHDYPYDFALMQITSTFMFDNGGPHEDLVRFIQTWNARELSPRLHMATLEDFFKRLEQEPALSLQSGDWTDWWTQGFAASSFETALARQAHSRWWAARGLGALLSGLPERFQPDEAEDEAAWRNLALFDEHTWGMDESITHPSSPNTRGALNFKYGLAYSASAAITRLTQAAKRQLAAEIPSTAEQQVVVFNPLPWERRAPLYLPRVSSTSWALPQLERALELAAPQSGTVQGVDYGMIDLPAGGYVTLPLRSAGLISARSQFSLESQANEKTPEFIPTIAPGLPAADRVTASSWSIQNQFFHIQIDSTCGAIRSLISKSCGYEWVQQADPSTMPGTDQKWGIGHFVYETNRSPRGRADMQTSMESLPDFDRQPDLAPLRRGPSRVLECAFVPGVGKGRLALRLEAPGVEDLRVQIILYEDEPWIDLIYDLQKRAVSEPESVYLAFPLALEEPAAFYNTPGAVVQAEKEQLPYACRDFFYIQSWAALNDGKRGCLMVSPEAALVHFGGFTNHKYQPQLKMGQPNLVSWLMNNHWMTAYPASQQGWVRFTYRLIFQEGPFDPTLAVRGAAEFSYPIQCGPLLDRPAGMEQRDFPFEPGLPDTASLFRLEPASVQVAGIKALPGGAGIEVLLQEVSGQATSFSLHFPFAKIQGAGVHDLTGQESIDDTLVVDTTKVSGHLGGRRMLNLQILWKL